MNKLKLNSINVLAYSAVVTAAVNATIGGGGRRGENGLMRNKITIGELIFLSVLINLLDLIQKDFDKFLGHMVIFYVAYFLCYIVLKITKASSQIKNHKLFHWLPKAMFVIFVVSKVLLNVLGGVLIAVIVVYGKEYKEIKEGGQRGKFTNLDR